MSERDNNGKFIKRSTSEPTNDKAMPVTCNEDKLSIIQWNLSSNQRQLEIWQREYMECDHKDRDEVQQMLSHYAYRVQLWQDMLIKCLNDCDDYSGKAKA